MPRGWSRKRRVIVPTTAARWLPTRRRAGWPRMNFRPPLNWSLPTPSFVQCWLNCTFELKFHRRAQTELDRALSIDPNNAAANLLLRKLAKTRKVG